MDTVNKAFQTASDTVRSRTSSPTGEKPQSVKGKEIKTTTNPYDGGICEGKAILLPLSYSLSGITP